MTVWRSLVWLASTACLASSITVPVGGPPPILRRQVVQPAVMRTVRLHRSGGPYVQPMIRVRNGPVKRIYVPMKVVAPPQRYHPNGYKVGPAPPQLWKPQEPYRQPQLVQHSYRPHVPHNLIPQNYGPPRKSRHPKPKYPVKPGHYPKYAKKPSSSPVLQPFDSYKPQPQHQEANYGSFVTDSYGAPKPASYKSPTTTTYGKPHPYGGSPEPPKRSSSADEPATSYVNVYQGDKAREDGNPTFGYSQSHSQSYEKKHKGTVYSDPESLVSNHRPVYKPKSDTVGSASSPSSTTLDSDESGQGSQGGRDSSSGQGSFQPPKQTYGFQPYEDARHDGVVSQDSYGPSQPAQQYYKKQPDTVLGPNYFDQGKSS